MDMATYSSRPKKDHEMFTFWQLFERAAKRRYGQNIRVVKTGFLETKVNNIDLQLSVVAKDPKPSEKTRTIVDINMKEYVNRGKVAQDESIVQINKKSSKTEGDRFNFSSEKGVKFGIGGNLGAQVMGAAVAGGSVGISGHYDKSKSTTEGAQKSSTEVFEYSYNQEEKIVVPPETHVKATITTYQMKYEMKYTMKLSVERNAYLQMVYKTTCQRLCCFGVCRSRGYVNIRDMFSTLPNYNEEDEDDTASFTQDGTLSWVGEGCSVEKIEEPLLLI